MLGGEGWAGLREVAACSGHGAIVNITCDS